MTSVRDALITRLAADPNRVWTPVDFADLAPRTTIDKGLQRLTNDGKLRRIDRGLYDISARHFLRLRERFNDEDHAGLADRRVGRVSQQRAADAEVEEGT